MKLIGLALLLLSSLLFGVSITREASERRSKYKGILSLLRFIYGQIDSFSSPPEQIWQRFEDKALEASGFLPLLRNEGLAVALSADILSLGDETERLLAEFASKFGGSYKDEQLAACKRCIDALESLGDEYGSGLDRSVKLAASLSLTAALMLAVILI